MQSRNTCQDYPIIELRDLNLQSEDAGRAKIKTENQYLLKLLGGGVGRRLRRR